LKGLGSPKQLNLQGEVNEINPTTPKASSTKGGGFRASSGAKSPNSSRRTIRSISEKTAGRRLTQGERSERRKTQARQQAYDQALFGQDVFENIQKQIKIVKKQRCVMTERSIAMKC